MKIIALLALVIGMPAFADTVGLWNGSAFTMSPATATASVTECNASAVIGGYPTCWPTSSNTTTATLSTLAGAAFVWGAVGSATPGWVLVSSLTITGVTPIPVPTPTPTPAPPSPSITLSNGTASLTWTAPTTNADGTPITNLASYNVYQGTTATALVKIGSTLVGATGYTVSNLTAGSYYFAITAVNSTGQESAKSAVIGPAVVAVTVTVAPAAPGSPHGALNQTF